MAEEKTLEEILGTGGSNISNFCDRPLLLTGVEEATSSWGATLELTFIIEDGSTESVQTSGKYIREKALAVKAGGFLPAPIVIRERLSKKTGNTYFDMFLQSGS
jgi:hypothetical protein